MLRVIARQVDSGGKWSAVIGDGPALEDDSLEQLVRRCREAVLTASPSMVDGADYEIVVVISAGDGMTALMPTSANPVSEVDD